MSPTAGRTLILVIAALMLTAGCLGIGGDDGEDAAVQEQRADVTSSTGGIQGVVTDEAVQPIVGVNVTLSETDETVQTASDGSYAFSRVDPGDYTVVARGDGFVSSSQQTTVTANDVSTVDFVLTHLASEDVFTQELELAGFFECGVEVGWNLTDEAPEPPGPVDGRYFYFGWATCATPNSVMEDLGLGGNATNDKFDHDFELEAPLNTLMFEMTWDAQNQLSEWMTVRTEVDGFANDGVGTIFRTQGPSPVQVRLDKPVWDALADNFTAQCEDGNDSYCGYGFQDEGWPLQTRVFPAWQCASEDGGGCAVVQQPFTHFLTAFYNGPAPEGYTALSDS